MKLRTDSIAAEQQKMMQAARQAGFKNISIGSEAESLLAVFLAGNEHSLNVRTPTI